MWDLRCYLPKSFGLVFTHFKIMSPRFQWWYPNLVEWLMRKANDSVWYFRTSALLLTTVHPQLFTTVHCSPREPSEQKHFAVPNWWHQQGIWENLRALKITGNYYMECYLNSIIWDSIDIFLPFWPTLLCIRSQNPSRCPSESQLWTFFFLERQT